MTGKDFDTSTTIRHVLNELEIQSKIERSGQTNIAHDDMMLAVTKDTGKFLNILISSMKGSKILEVGTSVGYSTLWIALAFYQNGYERSQMKNKSIITIDNNPVKVKKAKKNLIDAGVEGLVNIIEGKALDVLYQMSNDYESNSNNEEKLFDFIFLDADKENLIKYFDIALPLLRKGGIIVTDNILYPEEYRPTMLKYTEHVRKNKSIMSVTVPIGYGEEVSLKIK